MAETIGVIGGPAVVNQVASMYPSVVLLGHDIELARCASPDLRAVVIDVDEGDVDRTCMQIARTLRAQSVGVVVLLAEGCIVPEALRCHLVVVKNGDGAVDARTLAGALQGAQAISVSFAAEPSSVWEDEEPDCAPTVYTSVPEAGEMPNHAPPPRCDHHLFAETDGPNTVTGGWYFASETSRSPTFSPCSQRNASSPVRQRILKPSAFTLRWLR